MSSNSENYFLKIIFSTASDSEGSCSSSKSCRMKVCDDDLHLEFF